MIKREFKINLKELIIWTSILGLMLILVFCLYPYIISSGSLGKIDEMIEMFPPEMLEMFNMDSFSLSTSFGWLKTEGYIFIILIGSIYSAIRGSNVLSKEEREKTIEFLISKPIKRNKIITSKIIVSVLYILFFSIILFVISFFGLVFTKDYNINELLLLCFGPLILYYTTFFISFLIATIMKSNKKTSWIGIALVFISYILQTIGTISEKVEILKKISLFEFVSLKYMLDNMHVNYLYLIIGIVISTVSIIMTYIIYNRKELV